MLYYILNIFNSTFYVSDDYTYDTADEIAEAFSSSLKTSLTVESEFQFLNSSHSEVTFLSYFVLFLFVICVCEMLVFALVLNMPRHQHVS